MRGSDRTSGSLFSYVDLEQRVPAKHPLRTIRSLVNEVLASLDGEFEKLYGPRGEWTRLFAKHTGTRSISGRFVPGMLTNPQLNHFTEPDVLVVTDPTADLQALREAVNIGIPVVGLCDANNEHKYVDYVIPCNNKGRRALAVVYWLLAREVLKARGTVKEDSEFTATVDEFEATL